MKHIRILLWEIFITLAETDIIYTAIWLRLAHLVLVTYRRPWTYVKFTGRKPMLIINIFILLPAVMCSAIGGFQAIDPIVTKEPADMRGSSIRLNAPMA